MAAILSRPGRVRDNSKPDFLELFFGSILCCCLCTIWRTRFRLISQMLYELITEISWKSLSFDYSTNNLFTSQICTCHDSLAVVTCAKLWPDLIIILHAITTKIWILRWWTFMKQVPPGHQNSVEGSAALIDPNPATPVITPSLPSQVIYLL